MWERNRSLLDENGCSKHHKACHYLIPALGSQTATNLVLFFNSVFIIRPAHSLWSNTLSSRARTPFSFAKRMWHRPIADRWLFIVFCLRKKQWRHSWFLSPGLYNPVFWAFSGDQDTSKCFWPSVIQGFPSLPELPVTHLRTCIADKLSNRVRRSAPDAGARKNVLDVCASSRLPWRIE